MKKQLLTVGDSFTAGDELTDPYQAWPYRVAERHNYELYNLGQSGCSNASILRRTIQELSNNRYDLLIVGWTSPGRIEWKDDIGLEYDMWPGQVAGKFIADHPWRQTLLTYISEHHNSAYLYQQYLIQVLSLQSYCQVNDIDLLMMDIQHTNYYRSVGSEQHHALEKQINSEIFVGFNQFGMSELTQDLPRGPGGHPLEKGHKRIADEISTYIRN